MLINWKTGEDALLCFGNNLPREISLSSVPEWGTEVLKVLVLKFCALIYMGLHSSCNHFFDYLSDEFF